MVRPITLINEGRAPLDITAITLAGDREFTVSPGSPSLEPGARFTVEVRYSPIAATAHQARLLVETTADNAARLELPVVGRAFADANRSDGGSASIDLNADKS